VASLLSTGFDDLTVFAEPESPIADWVSRQLTVVQRPARFGEWHNWLNGLEWLAQRAKAVLMVQDDVVFCRNVRAALEHEMWPSPKCGAIHVYTSRRYRHWLPVGLNRLPDRFVARRLCAACAVLFPRQVALDIVEWGRKEDWKGQVTPMIEPSDIQETDGFIGVALTALGLELWCHNPSLANHIGYESVLNHGGPHGNRLPLNFPGEDADALELCCEVAR
jgi:hypothetical protein